MWKSHSLSKYGAFLTKEAGVSCLEFTWHISPRWNSTYVWWRCMWAISLVWRADMYLERFLLYEILMCFFSSRKLLCLKASGVSSFRLTGIFKPLVGLKLRLTFKKHAGFLHCFKTCSFVLCLVSYNLGEKKNFEF